MASTCMTLHRSSLAAAAVATILGLGAMMTTPSEAKTLRMVTAFPENFIFTREIAKTFIANVEKASGGALTIEMAGPDTVPTFEQFEPVQSGVFDLLFTHPAYHSGTTAVGLSIDAIAVDPTKRRDAGIFGYIHDHYMARDMKLLSAPATGNKGFRYYLRDPISGTPGLEGRKIRGTVSYHPMIRALGGSPVNMPGGEIYTSLQKGVVDGAAWGLNGAKDFKWYEVADYLAEPKFGQVGLMIFMNADSFAGLSEEEQKLLADEGRKLELWSIDRFDQLAAEELDDLKSQGMKMTSFAPEEAAKFETLWAQGVWEVSEKISGADATALRDLAKSHGLTE